MFIGKLALIQWFDSDYNIKINYDIYTVAIDCCNTSVKLSSSTRVIIVYYVHGQ